MLRVGKSCLDPQSLMFAAAYAVVTGIVIFTWALP